MGNSLKMEVLGDEPAMPDCFSPFFYKSLSFSLASLSFGCVKSDGLEVIF